MVWHLFGQPIKCSLYHSVQQVLTPLNVEVHAAKPAQKILPVVGSLSLLFTTIWYVGKALCACSDDQIQEMDEAGLCWHCWHKDECNGRPTEIKANLLKILTSDLYQGSSRAIKGSKAIFAMVLSDNRLPVNLLLRISHSHFYLKGMSHLTHPKVFET